MNQRGHVPPWDMHSASLLSLVLWCGRVQCVCDRKAHRRRYNATMHICFHYAVYSVQNLLVLLELPAYPSSVRLCQNSLPCHLACAYTHKFDVNVDFFMFSAPIIRYVFSVEGAEPLLKYKVSYSFSIPDATDKKNAVNCTQTLK
jgi:hypothetical protein